MVVSAGSRRRNASQVTGAGNSAAATWRTSRCICATAPSTLAMQGFVLDPNGATALGLSTTNGIELRIE